MKLYRPPATLIALVSKAIDELFERIRLRVLGPKYGQPKDKTILFRWKPQDSLAGLFASAAIEEHTQPDVKTLERLLGVAEHYLEAQRSTTKANVIKGVSAFLQDAWAKGTKTDVETVLGGTLFDVWKTTRSNLERIVNTEGTVMRNMGVLEGILKVNEDNDVDDPVVYFVVVRDEHLCWECKRLHLLDDGITPRLWKLSEVSNEYFKKGGSNPCMSGLHPHCRCSLCTLMSGYGFNDKGAVTYVGKDHNELEKQRGLEKSESLAKSTREGIKTWNLLKPVYDKNLETFQQGKHPYQVSINKKQLNPPEPLDAYEQARLELAPLTVNLPAFVIRQLTESSDPRLVNTFEENVAGGGGCNNWDDGNEKENYLDTRLSYENSVLGLSNKIPPTERPIYGALAFHDPKYVSMHKEKHPLHQGAAPGYGKIWLELKPHVNERSTVHPGDTFHGYSRNVFPASSQGKIAATLLNRMDDYPFYTEAHVHGGVYLPDDVEAIHINEATTIHFGGIEDSIAAGKRFGLPVYRHEKKRLPGRKSDDWVATLVHDPRNYNTRTLHSLTRKTLISDLGAAATQIPKLFVAAVQELQRNQHDVKGHEAAVKAIRQQNPKAFPYLDENARPIAPATSLVQPQQPKPRKVSLPGRVASKAGNSASNKLKPGKK